MLDRKPAHHRRTKGYKGLDMELLTRAPKAPRDPWARFDAVCSRAPFAVLLIVVLVASIFGFGDSGSAARTPNDPAQPAQSVMALTVTEQAPASAIAEPEAVATAAPAPKASPPETRTVRQGDWFSRITAERGIKDWDAEAQRIGLLCPHHIQPGWVITFAPGANTSLPCPGVSKTQARPASTVGTDVTVQPAFTMSAAGTDGAVHTVQLALAGNTAPTISPAAARNKAVQIALSKVGKPYRWGASGPNAFDCSGLVKYSFGQAGKSVPRTSRAQAGVGTPVSKSNLQPGDLVFFYKPISHVGIYIGNGKIVHASRKGQPVKVSDMGKMKFNKATRV